MLPCRSSCGRDDSCQEDCGCLGRDRLPFPAQNKEKLLAVRHDANFNVWFPKCSGNVLQHHASDPAWSCVHVHA